MRRTDSLRYAAWLVVLLLGVRFALVTVRAATLPAGGFLGHYTASRLLLAGAGAGALYVDSTFIEAAHTYEPGVTDIFGANPPTVALTALPLALLDYPVAKAVWTVVTAALWLGCLAWLARACELRGVRLAAFVCIGLAFDPAVANVVHAQMHVVVLVLVLAAWRAWHRRRDAAAGGALGLVLALKSTGFVFWPMLAVQRRWRALIAGAGVACVLALVVTAMIGESAWGLFIRRAAALGGSGSLTVTAYQSVIGMVRRATVPDARWNPHPLLDAPSVGLALSLVLVLALLCVSLLVAAKRRDAALFAA
jgi:hypothetical protein